MGNKSLTRPEVGSEVEVVNESIAEAMRFSQHKLMQIPLHNHILHALHRLVQQGRIRSICIMHIGLLVRITHQILEFPREELLPSCNISVVAREIREPGFNRCLPRLDLFAEDIHFVEEDNERGSLEVFAVCYALEKHERFLHLVLNFSSQLHANSLNIFASYAIAVFHKCVVVSTNCN